jgi:hypothetical protein
MRKAKNGADRGTCLRLVHCCAGHGNGTCSGCGILLSRETASPAVVVRGNGLCRKCAAAWQRQKLGQKPRNFQTPGGFHTFPCACSGYLPDKRGHFNKFAKWNSGVDNWACRIGSILRGSRTSARAGQYVPIDPNTPHAVIRKMMEETNCERCQQTLSWDEFGLGKTPHLHHDHETGEIYGFTHPHCNPFALEIEIDRLKKENRRLRAAKVAA